MPRRGPHDDIPGGQLGSLPVPVQPRKDSFLPKSLRARIWILHEGQDLLLGDEKETKPIFFKAGHLDRVQLIN